MSKAILIKAKARENKKPNSIRRDGDIPATLYGHHIEAKSIQVNAKDFSKVPYKAYTQLNKLEIEGDKEAHDIIIKKVHSDPVKDNVLNIEFYQITKGEKVRIKVPLKFLGHSPAVTLGGVLLIAHNDIEIQCLPKDIPDEIEINLEDLKEVGQSILTKNLKFPENVIPLTNTNEVLVKVETPKTHSVEEEKPAEAAAATPEAAATVAAPAADAKAKK